MSAKHSFTSADYLEWDTMLRLIHALYADGNYRMSLLIACGSFFGLRISDLLTITWTQLLSADSLSLTEKKTGKLRQISINKGLKGHIKDCYDALQIHNDNEPCFINRQGAIVSNQYVNRTFKVVKVKYHLKVEHFSTHSLRKTFGRRVVDQARSQSEMALIKLSELFNHSSTMVTRRYLGLRKQELEKIYESLTF